jgi:DNA modification methylase
MAIAQLIEFRPISGLTAYARNARLHSLDQVVSIAKSMREWGWTMPVLVAQDCEGAVDGEIIAGHGRVLAAEQIYAGGGTIRMAGGDTIPPHQIPVVVARGWTAPQRRAYIMADNQLALAASWDESILKMELLDLREMGFNLSLTGFDDTTLAGYLDVPLGTDTDPDGPAPEPPQTPVTRLGDVWVLGRHRLLCGDATKAADVTTLVTAVTNSVTKPHLMVTDPPYGVEYNPVWRAEAGVNRNRRRMGRISNDDRVDWREAWELFPGWVAYVWHASWFTGPTQLSLEAARFHIRTQIIWAKDRFALSRGDYHWQHEPCWYAVKEGMPGQWAGDRSQSSVWNIAARDGEGLGHGTQKPLECMRRPMLNSSQPGDAVYDPFVGTGTSIVAAELTGRRCLAMDIDPTYVDVAILRWQNVTGGRARHEASGQSFEMAAQDRREEAEAAEPATGAPDQAPDTQRERQPHRQP